MGWIKEKIYRFLELDKFVYDEIFISRSVIYRIIEFANSNYPKEFVAFLKGKILNTFLNSKSIKKQFPLEKKIFETIHSHPGYSNGPSYQDLLFFNDNGTLHLIICKPFNLNSIRAYNALGKEINFKVY